MSRFSHHTPSYRTGVGNFNLSYHLEMLKDEVRVNSIKQALDEVLVAEGLHCELGVGTGVFAIYAAQRCKKVYAVEFDREIYEMAKVNILNSPFKDKIELIHGDAMDFYLEEKVDTLLVEMMSIWGINEPQVPIMNHAVKHILKKGGQSIPSRIVNMIELGHYDFDIDGVVCKVSIPQFTGISKPKIMTTSYVFNEFNFVESMDEKIENKIKIQAILSGVLNCGRLTSLVQLSEHITYYASDSLMPQTIIPLNTIAVEAGDNIEFSAAFETRTSIDESVFKVEKWKDE